MDNKNKRPFRVYRNLHKDNFSIQSHLKNRGWIVTDRAKNVLLEYVTFKVYETGRQRVLEEKRKNVHAYVQPLHYRKKFALAIEDTSQFREIYYNPYKYNSFVYKDTGEEVKYAHRVLAADNKLYDVSDVLIK
jgi:hypothetical protein